MHDGIEMYTNTYLSYLHKVETLNNKLLLRTPVSARSYRASAFLLD